MVEHSPKILAREEKAEKSQQQGMQIKRVGMFVKNNPRLCNRMYFFSSVILILNC